MWIECRVIPLENRLRACWFRGEASFKHRGCDLNFGGNVEDEFLGAEFLGGEMHRNSGAKFGDPRGRIWRTRNAVKFGGGCIRAIIYRTLYRTFAPGAQIFPLFESKLGGEGRGRK